MNESTDEMELKDRLDLIEPMIAEGRRTTESWGWTFVLWGVAYYVAIAWSAWGHGNLAWPVTMLAASALSGFIAWRASAAEPPGPSAAPSPPSGPPWASRSFLLLVAGLSAADSNLHSLVAIVGAMLGMANAASSFILRWKMQFACALVWWAAAVAACFGSDSQCWVVFLAAIFLCQIVFGVYGMIAEARERRPGASMPELPELNPIVHGKLRLALLSLLSAVEEAEFTWLRAKTGSTDGNLGAQLLKLEEAGYVAVEKKFVQRKPQTLYRMTDSGPRGAYRVRPGAEGNCWAERWTEPSAGSDSRLPLQPSVCRLPRTRSMIPR